MLSNENCEINKIKSLPEYCTLKPRAYDASPRVVCLGVLFAALLTRNVHSIGHKKVVASSLVYCTF